MTIALKIPIENIYYLLCYAWNKLDEGKSVDVTTIDSTNLLDLFAKVLIGGLSHLFKRGLDRGYITFSEDSRYIKGKICFPPMIKRNLKAKARAHCEHDELSYNVLHNQILKTIIHILIFHESLDENLRNQLLGFYRKLHEINKAPLNRAIFSRVQLHRNNAFYDFLLKICELIWENTLVSEKSGKSRFRDFIQDEKKMAYVFEEFVRNFYKIEKSEYKVGREDILWDMKPLDDYSESYLPKMVTDISIERSDSKAIIDTKYYKETLSKHYDREKIHSGHLLQLYGYCQTWWFS